MSNVPVRLQLICDDAHDGTFNMAADEFLLRRQIQSKDPNVILRFYRFSEPTLTVGYGLWGLAVSKVDSGIPFVRRLTGGGIVSHGISDLTYSLIAPIAGNIPFEKVKDSYLLIHQQLSEAFRSLGIKTELFEKKCCAPGAAFFERRRGRNLFCFDSPVLHDVMLEGKKIAGAAQKRTQGYLLQQGSIAWKLLLEVCPPLSESVFFERFAQGIGDLFNLSREEVLLPAEELKNASATL